MLTLDPYERLTAKEALQHPWIVEDDEKLAKRDLKSNLPQLRLFNARRKFKSTIQTVMLTNRLSRMPLSSQSSPGHVIHRDDFTHSDTIPAYDDDESRGSSEHIHDLAASRLRSM